MVALFAIWCMLSMLVVIWCMLSDFFVGPVNLPCIVGALCVVVISGT
jgi:hypothetical protein